MIEKEKNKKIKDLLYLNKELSEVITMEIERIMRDSPSSLGEIKEHLIYRIDEDLRFYDDCGYIVPADDVCKSYE